MRVVIAEDLALLREGMVRLLELHGCTVLAAAADEPELLAALRLPDIELAVLDVRLPPGHGDEGLRAAIAARRERPGLPVLVLSQYVETLYARELLAGGEGAIGYLLKDRVSDVASFVTSMRTVAAGGTVMDPEVIAGLVASRDRRDDPLGRLTPREKEALSYMAEGLSNQAIAARMVVSEKAVGKHTGNIFAKLDLFPDDDANRRVQAVLAYLRGAG
jgi:DNA-binding NarL/FixJ family response regulator